MNATKLTTLLLVAGLTAVGSCGTDASTPGRSVNGIFPAQGFLGRRLRVEIRGDATEWKDGATVSLGDQVTVHGVDVASPTEIFADITVDDDAISGLRDVTVTSGDVLSLRRGFAIVPPVELVTEGNLAQGGAPNFSLINRDADNPFDAAYDEGTGAYPNLAISGPANVGFFVTSASAFTVTGRADIDLDATSGGISLVSGMGTHAFSSNCGSFGVEARVGTPIDGSASGMIAAVGDTGLYSIAAAGTPSLVHVRVTSPDENAHIAAYIFTDNTWAHLARSYRAFSVPSQVTFVVEDFAGASGYQYTVFAVDEMLTIAPEGDDTSDNASSGALVATSIPFQQTGGAISSTSDVDYIAFTISAANANRSVHVVTDAGSDVYTDTQVDVIGAADSVSYLQDWGGGPVNNSLCSLFGCASLGENVISDPLPAGTYYLKISAGPAYATSDQAYTAMIWLE